jgi:hypothetical protein
MTILNYFGLVAVIPISYVKTISIKIQHTLPMLWHSADPLRRADAAEL